MSEIILRMENVTKKYGDKAALQNVCFTIERGKIYGFIGENGAGKTTTIRAITGLSDTYEGSIELFGASDRKGLERARRRIGSLVEHPILDMGDTAAGNLRMQQKLLGKKDADKIPKLLERVGLAGVQNKKVKDFSLGMKQRLGIALALINDPELLVLDEPVNGLDPMGMVDVREILRSLCEDSGITILISSHILAELYQLVTDYIIISHGQILEEISKSELDIRCRTHIFIETEAADRAAAVLRKECAAESIEREENTLKVYDDIPLKAVAEALHNAGILVIQITQVEKTLEQYYMELLGRTI